MIVFNSPFRTIQEVQEQILPLQAQLQSYEEQLKEIEGYVYEYEKRLIVGSIKDIRFNIYIYQALIRAMILNQAFVSTPPPPSKNLSSQKVLKSIESLQEYLKQI